MDIYEWSWIESCLVQHQLLTHGNTATTSPPSPTLHPRLTHHNRPLVSRRTLAPATSDLELDEAGGAGNDASNPCLRSQHGNSNQQKYVDTCRLPRIEDLSRSIKTIRNRFENPICWSDTRKFRWGCIVLLFCYWSRVSIQNERTRTLLIESQRLFIGALGRQGL